MKTLFIESKRLLNLEIPDLTVLPSNVGLLYTLQFKDNVDAVKKALEKAGKKAILGKGNLYYAGQVIGCNVSAAKSIENKVDCFLLITSGKWHAYNLLLSTDLPVYIIGEQGFEKLDASLLKQKRKAALSKFLFSDIIGIIVSTKPGQQKLKEAIKAKKDLEKAQKKVFIFIADTINPKELENFRIQAWLNTACPGLVFDIPNMINLEEYRALL